MTFVVFGMALVVVGLFVLFTRKLGISLSALGICVDFIQVNASSGLWVCSGALCGGLELVDRQSTCMYLLPSGILFLCVLLDLTVTCVVRVHGGCSGCIPLRFVRLCLAGTGDVQLSFRSSADVSAALLHAS